MSVYTEGKVIAIGKQVPTDQLEPNHEYIFYYKVPKVAFSLMEPSTLTSLVKSWVNFRAKYLGEEGAVFEITGAQIDTDTGYVYVRGQVSPTDNIEEAGVNPLVILGAIAAVFAVVGISATLLAVYDVGQDLGIFSKPSGGPEVDPCTTGRALDTIKCFARKTGWVAFGVGAGVLITLAIMVVLIGRREKFI